MSSGRAFDTEVITRNVRAALNRRPSATRATWLQNSPNRSQVAIVASQPTPEIEERAGLADSVPAVYLDAWRGLNCQKPEGVTEADWRRALEDGGRFLDEFGSETANLGWRPGKLFDVRAGLVWRLSGERVLAVGTHGVRLRSGLMLGKRVDDADGCGGRLV